MNLLFESKENQRQRNRKLKSLLVKYFSIYNSHI